MDKAENAKLPQGSGAESQWKGGKVTRSKVGAGAKWAMERIEPSLSTQGPCCCLRKYFELDDLHH